jgi:hypothetical protein
MIEEVMTDYAPGSSLDVPHADVVLSLVQGCGIEGEDALRITDEFTGRFAEAGDKAQGAEVLLSVVERCADARHPFAYLSVPLTTGQAYIELRAKHAAAELDNPEELRAERSRTVENNRLRALAAARRLRSALTGMVIDPSRLGDVPNWEQPDYHSFWTRVIDRYTEEVFFLDGWQYSVGCTIEFSKAVKMGLPTMTADRASLNARTGWHLVQAALAEYARVGLDPSPLRNALSITEQDLEHANAQLCGE